MHPTLIQIDSASISIGSYGTLITLAVVVSFIVGPRWALSLEGIDSRTTRRIFMILGAVTFLGGHLHYLWNAWHFVSVRTSLGEYDTLLWAGLHAGGAILSLVLATPLVLRWYGIHPGKFGDALVPTAGLGIAIARIGCFLQGCCFGTPCTWPWCITFPEPSSVWDVHRFLQLIPIDGHHSAPVHPLQLYFSAVGLLIMGIGLWLHPRKRYDGQVALVALVVFCATSAGLEGLRQSFALRAYWGPLPQLTWVALAMTAAALLGLAIAEIRHSRGTRRPAVAVST